MVVVAFISRWKRRGGEVWLHAAREIVVTPDAATITAAPVTIVVGVRNRKSGVRGKLLRTDNQYCGNSAEIQEVVHRNGMRNIG